MFKLGVVRREGIRQPRTLLGRRRHVSLLLLRELGRDPGVDAEEYDRLVGHTRMPNGVWKLTRHGRLHLLDAAVMDVLRRRFAAGTSLVVHDLAASTGVTSVEWFRTLRERFEVRFTASDLYRDLIAVCSRRWPVAVVFDRFGEEVQYVLGRFVLPGALDESIAYPINRTLKTFLRRRFTPRARAVLGEVPVGHLSPFESVYTDGYEVVRLPILTQETLETIASGDGFTFEEWNILEPLPVRAHVLRAMNILLQEHFTEEQRALAVVNCVKAVLPGGFFVVGSSPTPESMAVQASIYRVQDGRLTLLTSLNGGSDIDAVVARTFPVLRVEDPPSRAAIPKG